MKRKAISKRTRFDVFKRDGFTCQYCGAHPPQAILHIDHIIPVVDGGSNEDTNLVTACQGCNLGKSRVPLSNIPKSLAAQAKDIAEREEQLRGFGEIMRAKRDRIESESRMVASIFAEAFSQTEIRMDFFRSIKRFVDRLGFEDTVRAMEVATSRHRLGQTDCFKYFCGICWKCIKDGSNVS